MKKILLLLLASQLSGCALLVHGGAHMLLAGHAAAHAAPYIAIHNPMIAR